MSLFFSTWGKILTLQVCMCVLNDRGGNSAAGKVRTQSKVSGQQSSSPRLKRDQVTCRYIYFLSP